MPAKAPSRFRTTLQIRKKSAAQNCADQIIEHVPVVMRFIRMEMRRQGAGGLSVPQLRTLIFLSLAPGSGLSSVAEHLGVTRPTASALINRLVQQGLVSRAERPGERRRLMLTVTPAGSHRLQAVRESASAVVADTLADRSAGELKTIMDGVALLGLFFKEASHRKNS